MEDPMETLLRFEWGICAVCGIDVPQGGMLYGEEYITNGTNAKVVRKPIVKDRSMLCSIHSEAWRMHRYSGPPHGQRLNFHEWVRSCEDSHLLFHEFEMECSVCIPCPKCFIRLPAKPDYLCEECRYG